MAIRAPDGANNDGVCGYCCALVVIFCREVSYLLVYFLQLPKWLLFWEDLLQDFVQLRQDKVTDPYMHCRCHRSPVLHVLTKVPSRPPTYIWKTFLVGLYSLLFETFKYCFVKDSSRVKGHCNMFQSQHGLEDWALRLYFNKSVLKNFNRLTVDS